MEILPCLISRWLTETSYVSIFTLIRILEIKITSKICSRPGGAPPLKCGIIYLHTMASQRFNKYLDRFVNICHACGHKPTSVLLLSTMVVRMLWRLRCSMKRRWNWRKFFQKAASSAIHLIPYSVRFDESHDRISACDAIDLDMMHTVCVGEIGDKPRSVSTSSISPYMFGNHQTFRFFLPSFM